MFVSSIRTLLVLTLLCVLNYVAFANGQVCEYPGHVCTDDKDCCGGCCLNSICTDATRHCYDYEHLCLLHPCLGDAECKVYQAWDGSEPEVYCE